MWSMSAGPALVIYAKVMLSIFVGLGIFSVVMTVRVLLRKSEPNPAQLAAAKRTLLSSSWILIPVVGTAVNVFVTHEYWFLLVSGLLFSYLLPVLALYLRTRAAFKQT